MLAATTTSDHLYADCSELVEQLVPDLPRCELFGREPWAGAEVWGNQSELFGAADG